MLLYGVTDRAWESESKPLIRQAEEALKSGLTCLQLREKDMDEKDLLNEALAFRKLCSAYNVPLIINDNVDIAVKCGADGVHVGQEDMSAERVRSITGEKMILGVSAHTVEEALAAVKNGADYLGLGAIFPTSTKTDADVMSTEVLKSICRSVDIPTVAIGGINKDNVTKLSGFGFDGIAVVSAIFAAEDIPKAVSELRKLSEQMVQNNLN